MLKSLDCKRRTHFRKFRCLSKTQAKAEFRWYKDIEWPGFAHFCQMYTNVEGIPHIAQNMIRKNLSNKEKNESTHIKKMGGCNSYVIFQFYTHLIFGGCVFVLVSPKTNIYIRTIVTSGKLVLVDVVEQCFF